MKVVFINPPNTYELVGNDPVIIKDQQGVSPSLGMMYIAAHLKHTGRYDVHFIDAQADELDHEQVAERVKQIDPDVVGMMAMTFTLIDVRLIMQEIRKRCNSKIILGGPHVVIYPEQTIDPRGLGADYAVIGEGEVTMDTLLQAIGTGTAHEKIWRQEKFIEDMDELLFPARELTPIGKYYSILCKETPTTTAFSSRGCPFVCSFCDRPALGKGFRAMSAKRVVDEMQWCVDHNIKEIFFYDDTFSVSKKRVHEICDEIKRRGLAWQDPRTSQWQWKIGWDIRTRVNVVDESLIRNLSESGCERIHFGVESAVPRIIKELQKGITQEQVEDAFALCKQYHIKTLAYLMMGNPTETHKDVLETLQMTNRIRPDFMQMTILSPFPATAIYYRALRDGILDHDIWADYALNMPDDFRPPLWEEKFTRSELEAELRWFYSKFYLTPHFIRDRIMEVRNMGQFMRYARGGLSLLKMSLVPDSKLMDSWRTRTKVGSLATSG